MPGYKEAPLGRSEHIPTPEGRGGAERRQRILGALESIASHPGPNADEHAHVRAQWAAEVLADAYALLSSPRVEEVRREAWRVGMQNAARICKQFDGTKYAAQEIEALAAIDDVADNNLRAALSPPVG